MIGIIAGSFDPPTLGHIHLIEKGARLCDRLYVLIAPNSLKTGTFSLEQRLSWLQESTSTLEGCPILCEALDGLLIEAARQRKADVIIKGVRNGQDFEYEMNQARVNQYLDPSIQTIFLGADSEMAWISSSNVRELLRYHQDIRPLVPEAVWRDIVKKED